MEVPCLGQIDAPLAWHLQHGEKRLGVLHSAIPFQADNGPIERDGHPINSARSRTMSTLPSPRRLVPEIRHAGQNSRHRSQHDIHPFTEAVDRHADEFRSGSRPASREGPRPRTSGSRPSRVAR